MQATYTPITFSQFEAIPETKINQIVHQNGKKAICKPVDSEQLNCSECAGSENGDHVCSMPFGPCFGNLRRDNTEVYFPYIK